MHSFCICILRLLTHYMPLCSFCHAVALPQQGTVAVSERVVSDRRDERYEIGVPSGATAPSGARTRGEEGYRQRQHVTRMMGNYQTMLQNHGGPAPVGLGINEQLRNALKTANPKHSLMVENFGNSFYDELTRQPRFEWNSSGAERGSRHILFSPMREIRGEV